MADWASIETALAAWATALTGLTTSWKGRPQNPNFGDEGYLLLSHDSTATVGNDMLTTTYNALAAAGEEMETVQEGARTFTFGIQIRSYQQSAGVDAEHYASLVRDRVCLPVLTGEALAAADIAFARIIGDTPLGTIRDGREMSVHQMDLRMNALASASDTPTGYIATVKDADLEIPEGSVVDTMDFDV